MHDAIVPTATVSGVDWSIQDVRILEESEVWQLQSASAKLNIGFSRTEDDSAAQNVNM